MTEIKEIKEVDKDEGRFSVQTGTNKQCPINGQHKYVLVVRDADGKLAACTCLTCLLKKLGENPAIDELIKTVAMAHARR